MICYSAKNQKKKRQVVGVPLHKFRHYLKNFKINLREHPLVVVEVEEAWEVEESWEEWDAAVQAVRLSLEAEAAEVDAEVVGGLSSNSASPRSCLINKSWPGNK